MHVRLLGMTIDAVFRELVSHNLLVSCEVVRSLHMHQIVVYI